MNYRLFCLAILAVLASGCSMLPTDPPAPMVTTVQVPVAMSCIDTVPARPALISDADLLALPEGNFVTALHIDRLRRDGYEAQLEALIEGCK